ncbi:Gfo/Idh/MocA family oxidoreductase [Lacrimispora sp. NSJ-141]|uniref:Gfo/Idh/MocA family oxidoreductase n=1 Tax=Lientehia hominis TaxID=2897778 RepID=A0AAP2W8L0_9FIRM|nr:Gfo/Idh/MocA family oxidoreductase [Lientehia hominis]MCD2492325.1 Gfo/Idh/MocA family oxidoreductase [Lientehia hominis]
MKQFNWGILGLGNIAHEFADNMAKLHPLYAVASRSLDTALDFQKKYGADRAYGSYEELLNDPGVDVVYVATVNSQHYKCILACLEHGKHVLCEKAIWGNFEEMKTAYFLAQEKGLLLCEAMTIYHMPIFKEIKNLIASGKLGKIKFVEAELGSLKEDDPTNRFFNPDLGGGAMLDIGTYGLSFVTYFLSGDLTELTHLMGRYPTGVDEMWSISLKTSAQEIGSVNLTFRAKLPKRGIIAGEKAYITVMNYVRADKAALVYPDGSEELLEIGETSKALQYEIQDIEEALSTGDFSSAFMDCTMKVVELMDRLLKAENL